MTTKTLTLGTFLHAEDALRLGRTAYGAGEHRLTADELAALPMAVRQRLKGDDRLTIEGRQGRVGINLALDPSGECQAVPALLAQVAAMAEREGEARAREEAEEVRRRQKIEEALASVAGMSADELTKVVTVFCDGDIGIRGVVVYRRDYPAEVAGISERVGEARAAKEAEALTARLAQDAAWAAARAERAAQEAHAGEFVAAIQDEWVRSAGRPDMVERLDAGVLPRAEIEEALTVLALEPLEGMSRYENITIEDVEHDASKCDSDPVPSFEVFESGEYTAEQWAMRKKVQAILTDAQIVLRRHTLSTQCRCPSVTRMGLRVRVRRLDGQTVRCELAV